MSELYLGVISGTSADGIDIALVAFDSQTTSRAHPSILAAKTKRFDAELGEHIRRLMNPADESIDLLGSTDTRLGKAIATALCEFLQSNDIDASEITAIGCHGQTVRHRPEGTHPFSLQIGDPNQIAEITGVPVVADFRRRDMAAGGQGAPLVPAYHERLFRDEEEYRLVLNIGGIANLTCLPSDPVAPIRGFDTGPGNALLDDWISARLGKPCDLNGEWARGGVPNQKLLTRMLGDAYFRQAPPKSTGREQFHLAWVSRHLGDEDWDDQVVQSTLTELTARSIQDAVERWAPEAARVIVCGGGRHNSELMHRLDAASRLKVETSEDFGVDGDFIEAAAFAWFAKCTLDNVPSSRASVTGASGDRVLGGLYRP